LQVQHELLADVLIDNLQGNYSEDMVPTIKMKKTTSFSTWAGDRRIGVATTEKRL